MKCERCFKETTVTIRKFDGRHLCEACFKLMKNLSKTLPLKKVR